MKKTVYIFMSFLLLTYVGCDDNENLVEENNETLESTFFQSLEKNSSYASKSVAGQFFFVNDLMAGQHEVAGTVTVAFGISNLVVTYTTNSSWALNETHLYVGDKDLVPLTKKGNPKIGKFPYKAEHDGANEFTYTIPMSSLNGVNCLTVAAHAVVTKVCSDSPTGPLPDGPIGGLPGGSAKSASSKNKGGKTKPQSNDSDDCSRTETAWGAGTEFDGNSWAMYTTYCGGVGGSTSGEGVNNPLGGNK